MRKRSDDTEDGEGEGLSLIGTVTQLTEGERKRLPPALPIGFRCTPEQQKAWDDALRRRKL